METQPKVGDVVVVYGRQFVVTDWVLGEEGLPVRVKAEAPAPAPRDRIDVLIASVDRVIPKNPDEISVILPTEVVLDFLDDALHSDGFPELRDIIIGACMKAGVRR